MTKQQTRTFLIAAAVSLAALPTAARAALQLSAGVPAAAVNVAGGPVAVNVPLYVEQTGGTTAVSTVGLYSVGAAVARTAGAADITGAARFAANFDDPDVTVTFAPAAALFRVERAAVNGVTSPDGRLQFGSLTVLLTAAGTTTFALADNDLSPTATDTIGGDLEPLDHLLAGGTFSLTAVVPEPGIAWAASAMVAPLFMRRRRGH
jgi:hypothetical protein